MPIIQPICAVTIDFWNTLYDSTGGRERDAERFAIIARQTARLGATLIPEKAAQAQRATWKHFNAIWETEFRTPPTRQMVEFFLDKLGVQADEEAIATATDAFCNGILNHPPALMPGAKEALREFSERYYVALVSDTAFSPGSALRQIMERDGIAGYFDRFSFSDETGVAKPHPEAFRAALAGANCPPERCAHIGDIERTDVAGAKNLGMQAILFAGDPNAPGYDASAKAPTQADARAASWSEVLCAVNGLQD